MNKKSQSSIEFVIILGVVLFFFMSFLIFVSMNMNSTTKEKRDAAMNEICHSISDEINLASASASGYERNFQIPADILGLQYNLTLDNNTLFLISEDGKHAVAYSVKTVQGTLNKGSNIIENRNGTILLNP